MAKASQKNQAASKELAITALAAEPVGTVPVGSVIASMLLPTEMAKIAGHRWVPADGRYIGTDSAYAKLTGRTSAPDMRGVFQRGLNQFDPEQPARHDTFQGPAADDARQVGTPQADSLESHSHQVGQRATDVGAVPPEGFVILTPASRRLASFVSDQFASPPGLQTDTFGSAETRPTNAAFYYYIRIN